MDKVVLLQNKPYTLLHMLTTCYTMTAGGWPVLSRHPSIFVFVFVFARSRSDSRFQQPQCLHTTVLDPDGSVCILFPVPVCHIDNGAHTSDAAVATIDTHALLHHHQPINLHPSVPVLSAPASDSGPPTQTPEQRGRR